MKLFNNKPGHDETVTACAEETIQLMKLQNLMWQAKLHSISGSFEEPQDVELFARVVRVAVMSFVGGDRYMFTLALREGGLAHIAEGLKEHLGEWEMLMPDEINAEFRRESMALLGFETFADFPVDAS